MNPYDILIMSLRERSMVQWVRPVRVKIDDYVYQGALYCINFQVDGDLICRYQIKALGQPPKGYRNMLLTTDGNEQYPSGPWRVVVSGYDSVLGNWFILQDNYITRRRNGRTIRKAMSITVRQATL